MAKIRSASVVFGVGESSLMGSVKVMVFLLMSSGHGKSSFCMESFSVTCFMNCNQIGTAPLAPVKPFGVGVS